MTDDPVTAFSTDGIDGVYVGLERSLRADGDYSYAATEVVLLPDGRFRRNGLPRHGLDEDVSGDVEQFGSMFWGRWEQSGDQVVAAAPGAGYTFRVAPGGLADEAGRTWDRLPPMPLTPLEGVYARADYRDPTAPRVELGSGGTFSERGRFFAMVGSLLALVQPDGSDPTIGGPQADLLMSPGNGRCELRNYSLTLRYDDGRVARYACYLPPAPENAAGQAGLLVLGSYVLSRDA